MKLKKCELNPILKPLQGSPWQDLGVLNPACWYEDGTFYLLYRAAGNDEEHTIHLGLATSRDGVHFERSFDHPVLSPSVDGPDGGCIEDPRLVNMDGYYYLTYAARTFFPGQYWRGDAKTYGFHPEHGPSMLNTNTSVTYLAVSDDLIHWKRLGRMTDSRMDNRDVYIFPEPVNGRYVMLSRAMEMVGPEYGCDVPSIWISYSDDLLEWDNYALLCTSEQPWESKKVGGSTPPLKTDKGWLALYHGVSKEDNAYRVGALLLDLENPSKILARTKDFIMEPEFDYETAGFYNGCVFPTGNVIVDDTLYVYYGAADKFCCLATCDINELLDYLVKECAV